MSEYNQTVERNQEAGSIGIGAMIVFIALILVAAVASTIIIKTAEELQQNAESTSDDTRKEISGKVNIIQIIVNGSTNDDLDSMIVTAKIASGSTDVQVRDIEWALVCGGANGFGLITGNLGTENWYGGALDGTNPSPNADRLNGADYAAGDELAAGTTFKFDIKFFKMWQSSPYPPAKGLMKKSFGVISLSAAVLSPMVSVNSMEKSEVPACLNNL